MPRRKAAERDQPHKRRSRMGCHNCRKRKIKCLPEESDGRVPACRYCTSKGLICQRGLILKWEAEYAENAKAFGRQGVWSKQGSQKASQSLKKSDVEWLPVPVVEACHFIHSTVEDFENVDHDDEDTISETSILETPRKALPANTYTALRRLQLAICSPQASLSHSPSSYLKDPLHEPLISYYCERLCPLTVASKGSSSPFYTLVLPFCASSSSIVPDALLALSARHLARTESSWVPVAVRLEGKVLGSLRKRIALAKPSQVWQDNELPVVMMLLCLYEILNRCDSRWVVHLKGARDLIRSRRSMIGWVSSQQDSTNELTRFSERFFAFQDVIGRTACGEVPIFGSDYWDASDCTIDAWLGCSPALVSIICSVTELSRSKSRGDGVYTDVDYALKAASLEAQLSELKQTSKSGDDTLERAAECKRLSATIYLFAALYGAKPRTQIIKDNVRETLRHVFTFLNEDVAAGLIWPLFVAAVELDPLEDELWTDSTGRSVFGRSLVLRALDHMARASIANVKRTKEVIYRVWQARDEQVTLAGASQSLADSLPCDDWERFVAPVSSNISLA